MAKRGLQPQGVARRNKIILSAVKLFLEKGYEATTTAQIMKAIGMSTSSFFAAFKDKEALLLTLVESMFSSQFENASLLANSSESPLFLYAAETSLQIYITELSEPLRELYVMAYTLPSTSEYINQNMASKLEGIFSPYNPGKTAKDFYELDLASSGITRSFMAKRCDMYFTINEKLARYLSCCFKIFNVPEEEYMPVIGRVLETDLSSQAEGIIASAVARAEAGFEKLGIGT